MPTLLAITASPRGADSVSNSLTHTFADAWKKAHSDGTVVVRDLYKTQLPFVALPWIAAAYSSPDQHSPEMTAAIKVSDDLIAELLAADHIVLGAPMYNFNAPACTKAYIDHIVRLNKTFSASFEGLVKGKKMTILIASGSDYSEGSPMASYNTETAYLKQIFGFIGITDVNVILAGNTNDMSQGKITKEAYFAPLNAKVEAAAG